MKKVKEIKIKKKKIKFTIFCLIYWTKICRRQNKALLSKILFHQKYFSQVEKIPKIFLQAPYLEKK